MYTKLKSVNVQQTNDIIQMQSLSTSKLVIMLQVATVTAATTTSTARYGAMVPGVALNADDLSDGNPLGLCPESRSLASLVSQTACFLGT